MTLAGSTIPAVAALALEPLGDNVFRAGSVPSEHRAVVFGGQLMGQMIAAAQAAAPDKTVRSVQVVFARAGSVESEMQVRVDAFHGGRSLAATEVSVSQHDRQLCRGLLLSDRPDQAVVELTTAMPSVPGPDDLPAADVGAEGADVRMVDGAPDRLDVWFRWPAYDGDPRDSQAVHQALLAWCTDPYLIPAALRAVPGLSLSMAHDTLSTGVLQHSLVFHRPVDVRGWHLISQQVTSAGAGRVYGTGNVFAADGTLVAAFSQWAMIRPMPTGAASGRRSAM